MYNFKNRLLIFPLSYVILKKTKKIGEATMAKNALFRTGFRGYNRNDVTRYIEQLNVLFSDKENELSTQIKVLQNQLEVLPELEKEKERAQRLESELEALKKENADLTDAIGAQGKALEEKEASLADVTAKKDALEMRVGELSERCTLLESEKAKRCAEFEVKLRELKELSDETDALKASLYAEKEEFEKNADKMLLQIQNEAKATVDRANETAREIIEQAKKRASSLSTAPLGDTSTKSPEPSYSTIKKKDSFSELLDSHKSKMDSFFANLSKTLRGDGKQ